MGRELYIGDLVAAGVQLSRMVVDFKNELEKCREQVQNLE